MMGFDVFEQTAPSKRAPQMTDVAAAAKVSMATVDRVLNRRKGVKQRTTERVLQAALDLGFLTAGEFELIATPRPPNIVFLLPAGANPYLRLLGEKLRVRAAAKGRDAPSIRCIFIESFNARALADALRHHAAWADGIAFMAIDHPEVREAVEAVTSAGTRVVTIVSDLPHPARMGFVGLDNQSAGRTAAMLLARFSKKTSGSLALVAGSRNYRTHSEREAGFLALLEEMYPDLRVVGVREGHDDAGENYRHAMSLLQQHPDLIGIYNVGGSSNGIARALVELNRAGDVLFIGHGLTADTRKFLIDGTMDAIIDANPDTILSNAISLLCAPPGQMLAGHGQSASRMDIFFRENLPSGTGVPLS
ncbi:LacI family DNA-binding transcriptional regulator [Hoeflea ulvae]|uniref:LacI family DNA-binding transcriptional regulator n=1 Tax=Hoeflea ulvae TaxID=2983764 RepID=A0ABT3YLW4_9HYPH|nr:LacI family DNA-binding transcriptional regulator [Hoeflea ulvae]MCY0096876.1 LacI family DNA-binding transcriptional regulator [Hoeflea ulvae]